MIISIIQPCFIPWLGYFEQIAYADIFVYLDDVQYTKKDWRNTNQLKSPSGLKKVYFPVQKTNRDTIIKDVLISYNESWQTNLLNKITEWYKKAPYFVEIFNLIESEISEKYILLTELNMNLNNKILRYLDLETPIYFSSNIPKNTEDKNSRILEICNYFSDVDLLYDGKSAQNFLDVQLFQKNSIDVVFQNYIHQPYAQLWRDFIPYTSIIDLLMNCGTKSKEILLSSPIPEKMKKKI